MTAKELIAHLEQVTGLDEDVLVMVADCQDEETGGTPLYELRAVRSMVESDHAGTRHTTYLVTGDEMRED